MHSHAHPFKNWTKAISLQYENLFYEVIFHPFYVAIKFFSFLCVSYLFIGYVITQFVSRDYLIELEGSTAGIFLLLFFLWDTFLVFLFFLSSVNLKNGSSLRKQSINANISSLVKHLMYCVVCSCLLVFVLFIAFPLSGVVLLLAVFLFRLNAQFGIDIKTGIKLVIAVFLRGPVFYILYGLLVLFVVLFVVYLMIISLPNQNEAHLNLVSIVTAIFVLSLLLRNISCFMRVTFENILKAKGVI